MKFIQVVFEGRACSYFILLMQPIMYDKNKKKVLEVLG